MSATQIISTFSAEHVARITGLSPRQLAYWDRIGFFQPSLHAANAGGRPVRVYAFQDVVGLRVIAVLRKQHRVSLQHLRNVAETLRSLSDTPWSTLRLTVSKGEVGVIDGDQAYGALSGQGILVPLIDHIRHVREAAQALGHRSANQIGQVEQHRTVAHNARVLAGTRIPVSAVERYLSAGYTVEAILMEYPSLDRADIETVQTEMEGRSAA